VYIYYYECAIEDRLVSVIWNSGPGIHYSGISIVLKSMEKWLGLSEMLLYRGCPLLRGVY